jgi:hypothetical protein
MEEDEIEESKKNYETEITQTPELTTNIWCFTFIRYCPEDEDEREAMNIKKIVNILNQSYLFKIRGEEQLGVNEIVKFNKKEQLHRQNGVFW